MIMDMPSSTDLNETIHILLWEGHHPRDIRKQMQTRGIKWDYQFSGQGTREKARRRVQYSLCEAGCGGKRTIAGPCNDCLAATWG